MNRFHLPADGAVAPELIDGARLVALMVEHAVGVREAERVVLHEVNDDFFDSV